jgi:hypothetical protein
MDAIVAGRPHASRTNLGVRLRPEVVHFIRQANGLQRTAAATRIVDEGKRSRPGRGGLGRFQSGQRLGSQSLIHGNTKAKLLGGVVKDGLRNDVAGFFEEDGLESNLNAIRRPRFGNCERCLFPFAGIVCGLRMPGAFRPAFAILDRDGHGTGNLRQI